MKYLSLGKNQDTVYRPYYVLKEGEAITYKDAKGQDIECTRLDACKKFLSQQPENRKGYLKVQRLFTTFINY